ncbi:hypothetical protein ACFL47_09545 [Candidatus Latescibacterota bacterium]
MHVNKMAIVAMTMIAVTLGVSDGHAEKKMDMDRVNFDGDGFSLLLPVEWATKRQDMPLFSLFTCVQTDEKTNPKPLATISLMFGRKEEGHENFMSKVLESITKTELSDRGKVTIKKKKGTLVGEWVQFSQQVKTDDTTVRVCFFDDTTQVFIIICQAPSTQYETYAAMFQQIGESLIIE